MSRPSDGVEEWESRRAKIIGLGERSLQKSYYPQLQRRLAELERFRALLDQANDAIFLLQIPSGRLIDVNDSACHLLGRAREALLETTLDDLVPLCARKRIEVLFGDEESWAGEGHTITTTMPKRGGEVVPVEMTIRRVALDDDVYATAVARDITERHRAEEALRASEDKFRSVVEQSSDGIALADERGVLVEWNAALEEISGLRAEEVLGRDLWEVMVDLMERERRHPRLQEHLRKMVGRALVKGRGDWAGRVMEQEFHRPDGSRRSVQLSIFPIETEEGFMLGSIVHDTTERQRMEASLRQQERLAGIGQLAGGIAHDFRNFLTTIILQSQLAQRKEVMSPELKKALDLVTNEAQKAADLVQQLLDFSRSSMMETQPVDLIEVVGEATDLLRQAIPENIQLVLEIKPTTCVIDADPTRIQQALMNLALNARDAMPEGGELRFSLSTLRLSPDDEPRVAEIAPGSWVRLVVSDTGVGMSEEVRAHIFEPFFTTKERGEGTGLGLAQVYGIVKQHHGYIDVRSQVGEGTSFRIWLPAHEEPPAQEEEPREVGIPRGHGETILVVEDAEKTRLAMRETLKLLGYRVSTAADGQEGLETALELEGLDLVITDVVMPQMGGEGLLRALREERPALPVVALTGYVSDVDLQALREAGFYAVVSKPLQLEDLAALVHRALRGEGR